MRCGVILLDFACEFGDDRLSSAFADLGEFGEGFGVLRDDQRGDGRGLLGQRSECFAGPDAFDGGEGLEKRAFIGGSEPDESWDEAGALALGFEEGFGVEGDLGADFGFERVGEVGGDQRFDREIWSREQGRDRDGFAGDGFERCGQSGDHGLSIHAIGRDCRQNGRFGGFGRRSWSIERV